MSLIDELQAARREEAEAKERTKQILAKMKHTVESDHRAQITEDGDLVIESMVVVSSLHLDEFSAWLYGVTHGAEPTAAEETDEANNRIRKALLVAEGYGIVNGSDNLHKAWVIDQMVRALLGPTYESWVMRFSPWPEGRSLNDGVVPRAK